jgi:uncharacterized membrane protein
MIRPIHGTTCLAGLALLLVATSAHAELTLCNRTSYRVQAAIGLEKRANVSTRGWFRVDPGACKRVLDGTLDADLVYVHARTPQARFTAARPSDAPAGPTVYLAEDAGYDDAQARLAGIQRLLTIAGYDAYPIDGVQGSKTQSALTKFLGDHKLPADAVTHQAFFDTLLAAARGPQGAGFSWCNDTKYTVMASLGVVEMGSIVTRGWYRVGAGKCLRPDLRGAPHRLYSYAEAVDGNGRTIKRDDAPLSWGGKVALCTRDGKFELSNHKDCAARGLNSAGFAVIDAGANPSTTVRFKEP